MKCEGTQYRWIAGKQVKVDQEVSIVDVKSSLMSELCSDGGSISVNSCWGAQQRVGDA